MNGDPFTSLVESIQDNLNPSRFTNVTAKEFVKGIIDVLDADVSELDPQIAQVMVVSLPLCFVMIMFACAWINKCRCCCLCCFGRRLVPNTDAKDDIIGDDEFDPEAVHTDPPLKRSKEDVDDVTPTSPPVTESSEDDDSQENQERSPSPPLKRGGKRKGPQPVSTTETAYEKDSKACCNAVATCLEKQID